MNWYPEAEELLLQSNYPQLTAFYENLIENDPDNIDNYWYLGLAYLFLGKEEEAQTTWFFPMGFGSEENLEIWTENLVNILDREAIRQEKISNNNLSWLIRCHLREISPQNFSNLLKLIKLECELDYFKREHLEDYGIFAILPELSPEQINSQELLETVVKTLTLPCEETIRFAELSLPKSNPPEQFVEYIAPISHDFWCNQRYIYSAIELTKLCLKVQPTNLLLLNNLYWQYNDTFNFKSGLEITNTLEKYTNNYSIYWKVYVTYLQVLGSLKNSDRSDYFQENFKQFKTLLQELLSNDLTWKKANQTPVFSLIQRYFISMPTVFLYLQDNPKETRYFINKCLHFYEKTLIKNRVKLPDLTRDLTLDRPLKIGYLSNSLRRHSVGWLARWLINYHNQEQYPVYIYHLHGENNEDDLTNFWYKNKAQSFYQLSSDIKPVVEQIEADKIDILIDLESLTSTIICEILAYKPAPIQVSWMGYDASGLSTMDYFLADDYVLPENAQEYYQEKIWRLPQTYLAVDGFEVFAPTLKRKDLDIPEDSLVYFSSQNGWKRNPHNISLQLEILKSVPHSYLLLKGLGDQDNMKQLFYDLASEIGVEKERLRFLPEFSCEEIYRANLQQLADIVLDTYPYSGATTTLETLWLGIPLVTRVGEQWAARNSYAFMMNAGITEGIAWSDQEYIDWGIRLGQDEDLRAKVSWKLHKSRQTSPLWNAKQFTKEMENAYRQMWEIYLKSK